SRRPCIYSPSLHDALPILDLAARYVSGYLRSGGNYQGAQASHAWVSVFIPGWGWLDLDPTNNVIPSEGHITVAWGRDYGDVTPRSEEHTSELQSLAYLVCR